MTAPILSVAASGFSGRGYAIPTRTTEDGKFHRYMGVTTALGVLDKGGVLQWSIDNTIAYAMHNIARLAEMEPHQQFGFLRFYHSRFKEADFDDPLKDISDASSGVLNDLAELGTLTHTWIEDNLNDRFEPEIFREEQAEMIEAFLEWKSQHKIEVVLSEATVVGENWAGTLDHLLIIECLHDGPTCLGQAAGVAVPTLVDVKTSRRTRREHIAQLAALGSAQSLMREVPAGAPGAVEYKERWWIEDVLPSFSEYAILHVRPGEVGNGGVYTEPFCKLKHVPHAKVEAAYDLFTAAVDARLAERKLKQLDKELGDL